MESESGNTNTKISDSGYSNSNSQRSVDTCPLSPKRNKDKEHKKKKLKATASSPLNLTSFENNTAITKENAIVATPPHEKEFHVWMKNNQLEKSDDTKIENELPSNTNKNFTISQSEDGFSCVVSLSDGIILYTTPSLTRLLGFPKDMWLGRSFIDFVHPKDRDAFSAGIVNDFALPSVASKDKSTDMKNCLYVRLRKYRGLKSSGFGVVEKAVSYQAFQLTVTFRPIADMPEAKNDSKSSGMFLVIVAVPVRLSYQVSDERKITEKFCMRHTAACIFSHVDSDVVGHFGFLPQDMLGKSVFDFFHPEDMPYLKEVYESVIKMCQIAGSVFRSEPYRFAVQNGDFALIETEWSSFVNPWSRKIEFITGLHRVIQGPANPDVFETSKEEKNKYISEEVLKESKVIQAEIILLLNEGLPQPSEATKHEVSKRCKNFSNFMNSLMFDPNNRAMLQLDLPQNPEPTISERDSVMLGEISPHDNYDSKSSVDIPPSYNQLNYNENLERFFQSKPKTTLSDDSNGQSTTDTDPGRKNIQDCSNNQKSENETLSLVPNSGNSGESGSGSAENLSAASDPNNGSGTISDTNISDNPHKAHLTQTILSKHNEDMERIMIKRHREQRSFNKDREYKKTHPEIDRNQTADKTNNDNNEPNPEHSHGKKRRGSLTWEGDCYKFAKHKHQMTMSNQENNTGIYINPNISARPPSNVQNQPIPNIHPCSGNDVNLWPPFSVTVTSLNNTPTYSTPTCPDVGAVAIGMYPIYYIPSPQQTPGYQVQYMPGMICNYNSMFATPPVICSTLPVFPVPVAPPNTPVGPDMRPVINSNPNNTAYNSMPLQPEHYQFSTAASVPDLQFQRPPVHPGSSISTASGANRVNKSSNEIKKTEHSYRSNNMDEESSYSSSYSSFLKTDTGSGWNDDSNTANNKTTQSTDDNTWNNCRCYPAKKKDPPWVESVSLSSDLAYRYQVTVKELEDILQSDLDALKNINQPTLVNDQLNQLYIEMELEGLSTKLTLEEEFGSSSSSGEETFAFTNNKKRRKSYNSLMMIYEENAPFPPPDT